MSTPNNFEELQNGFFNAFLTGMGFKSGDTVQLLQPSNPLISGSTADTLLWQYFNFLPPDSLTASFILSGGNQFLSNYISVLACLEAAPNDFEKTIGKQCFDAWNKAIADGKVKDVTPANAMVKYRNWAMFQSGCSQSAVQGGSAFARAMLDPIFAAQMAVMPYNPAVGGTQQVDFVPGYVDMTKLLANAPSRSFNVAQGTWNTDVSQQWSQSETRGLFGLWGNSSSSSSISKKFSSSGVSLAASFAHVLQFAPSPGDWYNSGTFGLAFENPKAKPWVDGCGKNWDNTFGSDGNMQRFAANAIVVDTMDITVVSQAAFSASEQQEVHDNSHAGLWPFYNTGGSSSVTSNATFDQQGNMTVRIKSTAGVPVVVAVRVLPAKQYLGQ